MSELLHCLKEKVWLIGQSLGGIVAQIIAAHHAEVVEGLVLSNTCSLSKDMSPSAYKHLMNMIKSQKNFKRLLSFLPFSMIKRLIRRAVMNQTTSGFTQKEKELMEELCDVMMKILTKPYELHMIDFLIDAKNHFGMSREKFFPWENKVLLILSEDDTTFTQECKDALISVMTNPTVVTNLTGGHLALLVRLDEYTKCISSYIYDRVKTQ